VRSTLLTSTHVTLYKTFFPRRATGIKPVDTKTCYIFLNLVLTLILLKTRYQTENAVKLHF